MRSPLSGGSFVLVDGQRVPAASKPSAAALPDTVAEEGAAAPVEPASKTASAKTKPTTGSNS
ncbi:hypothetical protein QCD60_23995 [Pokkaliibacter sp. MBI-7]|uniref:hypothetical protein n=1 Tax=Pokkaliibacter sp. MBI-7 TaxID=3040600 RepID=UPI00244D7014|nr:hypothetical protein [Pokkaliibacter sp. MBI-7]MDH2435591.1 hypothetical protein [Pokkaliibacter sp. MBI-7]